MPAEPGRILIVRLGALGDVARLLPILSGLRARFPDAGIDWIVQPKARALLEDHPLLDEVFVVPVRRWRDLLGSPARALIRRMRARDYDLVLDFQGTLKGSLAGLLVGKRAVRVGWGRGNAQEATWLLTHGHRLPPVKRVNRHVRHRALVEWLGVPDLPAVPPPCDRADLEPVERMTESLAGSPRPWILIYPGTSPAGAYRRWVPERMRAAAREIAARTGGTILVGWGPAEEALAREMAESLPGARLIPPTTIRGLMAAIGRADLFVGMNTGPMHLASLVGTPVVGVFGDRSDPVIHGPAAHHPARVVGDPAARDLKTHQRRGLGPFEGPEPEAVVEAALELLERYSDSRRAARTE